MSFNKKEYQRAYMRKKRKKNLSGGVESRHAGYRRESSYSTDLSEPEGRENASTSRPSSCTVEQLQGDSGSSAPPAQNNLPNPAYETASHEFQVYDARIVTYDKKKYPNRQAWEIAVQRVERAIRYAQMFPHLIGSDDLKFQTLDWQYENEGLKSASR